MLRLVQTLHTYRDVDMFIFPWRRSRHLLRQAR